MAETLNLDDIDDKLILVDHLPKGAITAISKLNKNIAPVNSDEEIVDFDDEVGFYTHS